MRTAEGRIDWAMLVCMALLTTGMILVMLSAQGCVSYTEDDRANGGTLREFNSKSPFGRCDPCAKGTPSPDAGTTTPEGGTK